MASPLRQQKSQERGRNNARRALDLWERGHSLRSISDIMNLKAGQARTAVDLGLRLRDAGL